MVGCLLLWCKVVVVSPVRIVPSRTNCIPNQQIIHNSCITVMLMLLLGF